MKGRDTIGHRSAWAAPIAAASALWDQMEELSHLKHHERRQLLAAGHSLTVFAVQYGHFDSGRPSALPRALPYGRSKSRVMYV
jgi:hypothetical protein